MRRKFGLRLCALALVLALCAAALPAGAEDAAEAAIVPSGIEDDGVVRVYLKSLNAPEQLKLTLDGCYTVEHDAGFRFARGTHIALTDGGDSVWLTVGGLTLDMGASLTLTRQYDGGEENGLRIAETGRDTLYAGDLRVRL